ncbi:MAG: DUF434 domain-containing protein [Thermoprotei archaeon]|nr:MAG: DUF434 domain-containing protein [Thermoprotei archaeon]
MALKGPSLRREVRDAIRDYKYLLNRGYPQKASLDLITSRYLLRSDERSLLLRCVHRDEDAEDVRRRVVSSIAGEDVAIDGYNTLLTVVSALECRTLYVCDDGIVRDLRSSYIKDFSTPVIIRALELVASELERAGPGSITVVLDRSVSWSAKHSEAIREVMPLAKVVLARKADIEVILTQAIACTSDFVILRRARRAYDLAGTIVKKLFPEKVVDINPFTRPEGGTV